MEGIERLGRKDALILLTQTLAPGYNLAKHLEIESDKKLNNTKF